MVLVIIIVGGTAIFVPIASVIIYQLCFKKKPSSGDVETGDKGGESSKKNYKKLPKNVVAVQPADAKKSADTTKEQEKKPEKKAVAPTDKDDW